VAQADLMFCPAAINAKNFALSCGGTDRLVPMSVAKNNTRCYIDAQQKQAFVKFHLFLGASLYAFVDAPNSIQYIQAWLYTIRTVRGNSH
jgi:hypothetical protein